MDDRAAEVISIYARDMEAKLLSLLKAIAENTIPQTTLLLIKQILPQFARFSRPPSTLRDAGQSFRILAEACVRISESLETVAGEQARGMLTDFNEISKKALSLIPEETLGKVIENFEIEKEHIAAAQFGDPQVHIRKLNQKDIQKSVELKEQLASLETRIKGAEGALEKVISSTGERIAETTIKSKEQIDTEVARLAEHLQTALKDIQLKQDQLDVLIGASSSKILAGGYGTNAASEKSAANFFRGCTIFLMIAVVYLAIESLRELANRQLTGVDIFTRFGIVFLLLIPVTYLARESTKHRDRAQAHLQTALDIAAAQPYLSSMPTEMALEIRSKMAMRLFVNPAETKQSVDSIPLNLQELLTKIIEKIEIRTKG